MPKITVIVPIYQAEKYIRSCIDSVLSQSFTDFELLLVDDGSPDNCGKICDEYSEKDNRVKVIHKKNGGVSSARNAGIDWAVNNSQSEWLSFIDSDDTIEPDFLKKLYEAASESGVDFCSCYFSDQTQKFPVAFAKGGYEVMSPEQLFVAQKGAYSVVTKLFNKKLFNDLRFDETLFSEDSFLTYKLMFMTSPVCSVNSFLYNYNKDNDSSETRSTWNPKKLDEVRSHIEMVDFFNANNYKAALKHELKVLEWVTCSQINKMKQLDVKDAASRRFLHDTLKDVVRISRNNNIDISVKTNPTIYEFLYPRLMWIYWTGKSIINKIK